MNWTDTNCMDGLSTEAPCITDNVDMAAILIPDLNVILIKGFTF